MTIGWRRLVTLVWLLASVFARTEPTFAPPDVPSTVAPPATRAAPSGGEEESGGDRSLGQVIVIVVAGLVLVAIVLSIVTWRYWRATRPVPTGVVGPR